MKDNGMPTKQDAIVDGGEGFMAGWRGFWSIAGEFAGFTAGAAVVLAGILAVIFVIALVMSQCSTPVEAQRAEAGMSCTGTATERLVSLSTTYDLKVTCR